MSGLRNNVKRREIFMYHKKKADIICLQETHSDQSDINIWEKNLTK